MTDTMQGKRVEWRSQIMGPGEYAKLPEGIWYAETPNGHCANLAEHQVTEHEDGSITVSPSILVFTMKKGAVTVKPDGTESITWVRDVELWHGFLERGVWREC